MKLIIIIAALTLLAATVQTEPAPQLGDLMRGMPVVDGIMGGDKGKGNPPPSGLFKTKT